MFMLKKFLNNMFVNFDKQFVVLVASPRHTMQTVAVYVVGLIVT